MKKIYLISMIYLFTVTFTFAQPNWTPIIYTNSTTAYGIVTLDGNAASAGDIVGAFVSDECRAVGNVVLNGGTAYVTLVNQGEAVETVNFKFYDASTDAIYDLSYTTNSSPGNTIGYPDFLPLAALTQIDSLEVLPVNRAVESVSGTTIFNVESNISWAVTESEDWLSVTPTSGSNGDTLIVSYDANLTTSARVGNITISGEGLSKVVSVTQSGQALSLIVSPENQNINDSSGTTIFNVESNINWTVTESEDWLSVTPTSGSNGDTLIVSYDANLTTSVRVGNITISGEGLSKEVSITQSGALLPETPNLISPENNTELQDSLLNVEFLWSRAVFSNTYTLEGAISDSFDSLVVNIEGITDTSIIYSEQLLPGEFYWRVRGENAVGVGEWSETFAITVITGVDIWENIIPKEFVLSQNYPNPFNPSTTITYALPKSGLVILKVYDILGNEVANLVRGNQAAGYHSANFNASNLGSGVYFYTIKASEFFATKKMLLIK